MAEGSKMTANVVFMMTEIETLRSVVDNIIKLRRDRVQPKLALNANVRLQNVKAKYIEIAHSVPVLSTAFELLQYAAQENWQILRTAATDGRGYKAMEEFATLKSLFEKIRLQGTAGTQATYTTYEKGGQSQFLSADQSEGDDIQNKINQIVKFLQNALKTTDEYKLGEGDLFQVRRCLKELTDILKAKGMKTPSMSNINSILKQVETTNLTSWLKLDTESKRQTVARAVSDIEDLKKLLKGLNIETGRKGNRPDENSRVTESTGLENKQNEELKKIQTRTKQGANEQRLHTPTTDATNSRQLPRLPENSHIFSADNTLHIVPHTSLQPVKTKMENKKKAGLSKEEKLEQQDQQISNLKNRLSEMAGEKLKENNPNISDLSDPNRQTKLAERFSGVYDDEWSDAYEELTKSRLYSDEASVIAKLLEVVWLARKLCTDVMAKQRASFTKAFSETMVHPNQLEGSTDKLAGETEVLRKNTDMIEAVLRTSEIHHVQAQKAAAQASLPILKLMFVKRAKTEIFPRDHDRVATSFCAYAEKCIELLWLMAAQDPPMYLKECDVRKVAPPCFREYTGRGNIVQAVVWPALFLFEDGPLMAKGVVLVK